MIRVGSVMAQAERLAATIRGVREGLAGYRRAVVDLDARSNGTGNNAVLAALARRNPGLLDGLQADAMSAVRLRWSQGGIRTKLEELTYVAGVGLAHALARRLRAGTHVTNTLATRERKQRAGLSTTPGVATGALAISLDNARVRVE